MVSTPLLWLVSLIALIFTVTAFSSELPIFEWPLANSSVELARLAYCDSPGESIMFGDPIIEDFQLGAAMLGTKGFIGLLPSVEAIFVAYAGTGNVMDWVVDADAKLVRFDECDGCKVHQGFNFVEQVGLPMTLYAVGALRLLHPHYSIVVTGHSKGAAEATIAAMDLIKAGFANVKLITFGSPRVGNPAFAKFASKQLGTHYRVTHATDTVPSMPTHRQGYMHLSGEWYEQPTLHVRACKDYEDATCSAQWGRQLGLEGNMEAGGDVSSGDGEGGSSSRGGGGLSAEDVAHLLDVLDKSEADHLHYLGRAMHCPNPEDRSRQDSKDSHNADQSTNSTTQADPADGEVRLRAGSGSGGNNGAATENRTRDIVDERQEQRKVMAFALAAAVLVVGLFALAVCAAAREASRRAERYREGRAAGRVNVGRETELTPLITRTVAQAANKLTYNEV